MAVRILTDGDIACFYNSTVMRAFGPVMNDDVEYPIEDFLEWLCDNHGQSWAVKMNDNDIEDAYYNWKKFVDEENAAL